MTHTMPVAGSSPGLLDHRAQGLGAVRPTHDKIGSAIVHFPNDPLSSRQAKGEGQ
ncbi:MAG: hypothetical protein ACLQQM_11545 [Acidimicrobiales bacterium]